MINTADENDQKSLPLSPIQLNWERRDGNIVVTPSDGDRFIVKIDKAIEILRQHQKVDPFKNQFDVLIKQLASWLSDHQDKVSIAFLTAGESSLRFIVVRNETYFDPEFSDALSDLSISIANDSDLDLIKFSARALPNVDMDDLNSFLDPAFQIPFHGK